MPDPAVAATGIRVVVDAGMNNFCRACGSRLEPDAMFCGECGAIRAGQAAVGPLDRTGAVQQHPADTGSGRCRRLSIAAVVVIAGLGAGYVAASPYIVAYQLQSAVERRAVGELLAAVDRDALMRSLSDGAAKLVRQLVIDDTELGFESGIVLQMMASDGGKDLAASMHKQLSPEGLRELEAHFAAPDAFGAKPGRQNKRSDRDGKYLQELKDGLQVDYGYTGLNTFALRLAHPKIGRLSVGLQRQGLVEWKVATLDVTDVAAGMLRASGMVTSETQLAEAALKQRKFGVAQRWLDVLARRGEQEAQYKLGVLRLAGTGEQNESGVRDLIAAAGLGNLRAAQVLSRAYLDGVGVVQDTEQASHWMQEVYRIEPVDRWAAAVAFILARKGDPTQAAAWMDKAVSGRAHLMPSERTAPAQTYIVRARKATYAQYARDLRAAAAIAGKNPPPPAWVTALAAAGDPGAAGWGPLLFGMSLADIEAAIGPSSMLWSGRDKSVVFVAYDNWLPHGASLTLEMAAEVGLRRITLSVLPQAASLGLPLVARTLATDVTPGEQAADGGALALGCRANADTFIDYMVSNLDLITARAKRIVVQGQVLRVCDDGFVAGVEVAS
jgi:hypothetical protein